MRKIVLSIVLCLFVALVSAQISLPKVFADNMVLQRDLEIPVWGNSSPEATIVAELENAKATTKADNDGKWMLRLPKFKAGGPYTLKIYEKGKPAEGIVLNGILIGDVWLASGQSNMEMTLNLWQPNDNPDVKSATNSKIRLCTISKRKSEKPKDEIFGIWHPCIPVRARHFSAGFDSDSSIE